MYRIWPNCKQCWKRLHRFDSGKTAYVVTQPVTALKKRVVNRLVSYLAKVLKQPCSVVHAIAVVPLGKPVILLSSKSADIMTSSSPEAYTLQTCVMKKHQVILTTGKTELGLKRAVQRLILESRQQKAGLAIPVLNIAEHPWIAKREWTICPWAPDMVHRSFSNPAADKRLNI